MPNPSTETRRIFFAAFEPSGDVLAARLIGELRRRDPSLRFTGFGGPKMAEQGAELLEVTTEHAAIALGAVGQINVHRRRLRVLGEYLQANDIAALVPVDSPAANWSVCKQVRKHRPKARIVHLVCPQIWGWASWRYRRLRRLSDRVLCLLPFEPAWLAERGISGVFVGHPVFEEADSILQAPVAGDLPAVGAGGVKLALMPGSRPSELEKNWSTMLEVYRRVRSQHAGLVGVVAARSSSDETKLRELSGGGDWPAGLSVVGGRTPEVLRWADGVLVKSGTATLQVSSLRRPMVAFYNVNALAWNGLGRWLISARTFALPNIISEWQDGRRVVPEFIPHFGDPAPIVAELSKLVGDAQSREQQRAGLERVAQPFASQRFKDAAAEAFLAALNR